MLSCPQAYDQIMIAIKRLISSFKLLANCTFKFSFLIIILLPLLLSSCYFMGWHIHKVKPQEVDLTGFSLYSILGNDILTCSPEERKARLNKEVIGELDNDDTFYFLLLHDHAPEMAEFRDIYAGTRHVIPSASTGKAVKKGYWNCSYLYKVPHPIYAGYLIQITTQDGASFNAFLPNRKSIYNK